MNISTEVHPKGWSPPAGTGFLIYRFALGAHSIFRQRAKRHDVWRPKTTVILSTCRQRPRALAATEIMEFPQHGAALRLS